MNQLTPLELSLRLGLALFIGLVLGFEREQRGRAAGMRTTLLVCVAAALAMILSEYLFRGASAGTATWRPDPARLAAGVLAGMGFLGAGVILKHDKVIHGVTTAAVLWFGSILGMTVGAGYLQLGLIGFSIAAIALFFLPSAENRIQSDRYAKFEVVTAVNGPDQHQIQATVEQMKRPVHLKPLALEIDLVAKEKRMAFEVKVKKHRMADCQTDSVKRVASLKGVRRVRWC